MATYKQIQEFLKISTTEHLNPAGLHMLRVITD
jgi:hypothetical protein